MQVGGEGAVVALAAERPVEQGVGRERVGLPRLVGHVGVGLEDVDHRAVGVGEPHRHARAVHEARAGRRSTSRGSSSSSCRAGSPTPARPWPARPSRSRRCSGSGWSSGRHRGVLRAPRAELVGVAVLERLVGQEVRAAVVRVQADLEPLGVEGRSLRVGHRGVGEDVRREARALPPGDRAAAGAGRRVGAEAPGRATGGVVVASGHDDGLVGAREVPEPRHREPVAGGDRDQVGEQPLLLVRLRDVRLGQVDPVRFDCRRRRGRSTGSASRRHGSGRPRRRCPAGWRSRSGRGRRPRWRPARRCFPRCAASRPAARCWWWRWSRAWPRRWRR